MPASLACLVKYLASEWCRVQYILSARQQAQVPPPRTAKFSPGKQLTDITSHPLINHRLLLTRSLFSPSHSFSSSSLSTPRIPSAFSPSHPSHSPVVFSLVFTPDPVLSCFDLSLVLFLSPGTFRFSVVRIRFSNFQSSFSHSFFIFTYQLQLDQPLATRQLQQTEHLHTKGTACVGWRLLPGGHYIYTFCCVK